MFLLPPANPFGAIGAHLLLNPTPSSRISPFERKKQPFRSLHRDIDRVCCCNLEKDTVEDLSKEVIRNGEDTQSSKRGQWPVLKPWDVPWDWKVTACVLMPYVMSILLTWIVESAGQNVLLGPDSASTLTQVNSTDEYAIKMFLDQTLKSVAKLLVLYIFISPHQPLPDDVFSFEWGSPFNLKNGWILWAVGGLSAASFAAYLVKALISGLYTGHAYNEAEPIVRLLPMIGSSNISTVCLLGTLGILAPVCEEVLYRGFLLASLTKWLPMAWSVLATSAVFSLAHHSPGKSIEIFIFGTVLGLVYAQTRNLLAPIMMHSLWNCGVILLLTFLHWQGYDIQKYAT